MSFFEEDIEKLKKGIAYFNSLPEERKAFLVSNITTENAYNAAELENLGPFLQAIQNDISNYGESQIANKIYESGMSETYAVLFVKNIIKNAPTLEYQMRLISKISDEHFKELLPSVVNGLWVRKLNIDEVIKENKLTNEQMIAFMTVFRTAMNELLRRDTSDELIIKKCTENGFSKNKLDVLINTLKISSDFWRNMLVFSNTQDAHFGIIQLKEQNQAILQTLKEILEILREFKNPSNPSHYQ